jgi:uncharacterized protein DUF349
MPLMNFLNPKWKHSDPAVRLAAIKQCTDSDIVAGVAFDDSDKDVRLAAIKKIDDISCLEKVLRCEENDYLISCIQKSLNKLYSGKILSSSKVSECESYIQKIEEEEVLVKLVNSIDNYDIASLICSKLTTETLLAKIAKSSKNKKLSLDVTERISDIALLETLSKSALLSSVKKEASRKISESTGESEVPRKEVAIKAEYESLCQDAETLCNSTDWEKCKNGFAELKEEWGSLDKLPDEDYKILEDKFESICRRFTKKKQNFRNEEEIKHEKLKTLESICAQIQQCLETDEFRKKKEEVYKLKKKWKREFENISYADELAERFSKLIYDYDNKYKALQVDRSRKLILEQEILSGFITEIDGFVKAENFLPNLDRVKEIEEQRKGAETGLILDDDDLNVRFRQIIKTFFKNLKMEKEVQHWERWENYVVKIKLCEKASALFEQTDDIHTVAKSLKKLRNKWKDVGDVPIEKAQNIWRKFDKICNKIYKKCQAFYAELDQQKEKNLLLKITLCEKAELLKDKENSKGNADVIKRLQKEWKEIGPIPGQKDRQVFERFNNACNTFFERRKAEYEKVKLIYDENKKAKEALCEEAKKIIDMDIKQGEFFERDLKREWRKIGYVAREDHQALWNKFNEPILRFHENIMLQAPENLIEKENVFAQLKALLNSISESSDYKELGTRVKEVEKNWSSIGPVPDDKEKALNSKYSEAIDEFYKKQDLFYKEQSKLQKENLKKKKKLINILESVFESNNEKSVSAEKVKKVQSQWEAVGVIPIEKEEEIEKQYKGLCDSFFNGNRNFFNAMKQAKKKNLKMKIELCVKGEKLANLTTEGFAKDLDLSSLADELSFAIGNNFIDEKDASPKEKMKKLKDDWQHIGDVPSFEEEKINKRFKSACDSF